MKERPILFSGEMVRAILEGRKTQTRRVLQPQPYAVEKGPGRGLPFATYEPFYQGIESKRLVCPFGEKGDRLWVRETWATTEQAGVHPVDAEPVYRATDPDWETMEGWKWKPSIFMPRAFARIELEITGVRVERLQEISERDATWEGIVVDGTDHDYIRIFQDLWRLINGAQSWDANPWVWVVEFRRVVP